MASIRLVASYRNGRLQSVVCDVLPQLCGIIEQVWSRDPSARPPAPAFLVALSAGVSALDVLFTALPQPRAS